MKIPLADLAYIAEQFDDLATEVADAWSDQGTEDEALPPAAIKQAMEQLVSVLQALASRTDDPALNKPPRELGVLGEHGLHLLCDLATRAEYVGLRRQARGLKDLCFPFALWIFRHGGEFTTLEPVVDAIAELANRLSTPEDLANLFVMIDELLEIVEPPSLSSSERWTQQPWRILVLNRAIVATRSMKPELIERAYGGVAELLPEEAPRFFEEALEQMDVIGYPDRVRRVVVQFYKTHCGNRTLH